MPLKDVEWPHPRQEKVCFGCGEKIPAGVRCQTILKKDKQTISRHYLCECCAYVAIFLLLAGGQEQKNGLLNDEQAVRDFGLQYAQDIFKYNLYIAKKSKEQKEK